MMLTAVLALAIAAAAQQPPAKPADPHAGHQMPQPPAKPVDPHAGHDMAKPKEQSTDKPKEPIPPVSDADRAAAFPPELQGHAVHDDQVTTFVLFEQLEWQGTRSGGLNLENTTWVGGDVNRLWLRAEGESEDGGLENASIEGLWGHSFSRWWDVVTGVRQDFRPGDPQTWLAVGIQGLAPQWFEVEATGYVGAGGRTAARFEAEYDLLLTNRLILQPVAELEVFGKADPERGIGAGLSSIEGGFRLRYEIRRELAPYVGITWDRKLFGTADRARAEGEETGGARLAFGLRTWF